MFKFTTAIVRAIPRTFPKALRVNSATSINLHLARKQHGDYLTQLRKHIPNIHSLWPDVHLPDCPFVESTSTVIGNRAIVSNMGRWPHVRRNEIHEITQIFAKCHLDIYKAPVDSDIDGGDVINTQHGIFVGLSHRTNENGISFLSYVMKQPIYMIRVPGQHVLKSLMTRIDENTMVVDEKTVDKEKLVFEDFELELLKVPDPICANIVRIGDTVMMPAGYPKSEEVIRGFCEKKELKCVTVDISEFIKAEGDLSCLSILY
jgi:dimethylargininase